MILVVHPARIIGRPNSGDLLPALGPWGDDAQQWLKKLTGLDLAQIDQVTLVLHDTGAGPPVATYLIRTHDKLTADARLAAWGNPTAAKEGEQTFYEGKPSSYYLPAKEGGRLLVVGPAAQIREVIQSAGNPPALSRHIEAILPLTDAERDVTLVFVPAYLFGEGEAALTGPLSGLKQPLSGFFGDDARAAIFSMHFLGDFFLELRLLGAASSDPEALSSQFASRVRRTPDLLEDYLASLDKHPYGRKILGRFPEWMRLVADETRNDVEDDQPILRCYLPLLAAPNLLMATDLALSERPGQTAAPAGGDSPKTPQTVAERLKKKTTLSFPRDTLEKALQLLFDDVGVKYQILGADMQLEGITKNQSFGLDERDKPADEILRKIMLLANPDGKLVYVVKSAPAGGPEMVFITTRAAAAKRGDKLPPELQTSAKAPKPPAKKKP